MFTHVSYFPLTFRCVWYYVLKILKKKKKRESSHFVILRHVVTGCLCASTTSATRHTGAKSSTTTGVRAARYISGARPGPAVHWLLSSENVYAPTPGTYDHLSASFCENVFVVIKRKWTPQFITKKTIILFVKVRLNRQLHVVSRAVAIWIYHRFNVALHRYYL